MSAVEQSLLQLAAVFNAQDKTLIHGRHRWHRFCIMLGAGGNALIEDVPMPELPVAAEVELARTDATDGHADFLQVRAAIDRALAARGQRREPLGPKLLIHRDQLLEVGARERPRHGRPGSEGDCPSADAEEPQKLTPSPVPADFGFRHSLNCGFRHRLW